MKRNSFSILLSLLFISILFTGRVYANSPPTDRENFLKPADRMVFSQNVLNALRSENTGLQVSAMQKVVKYKDVLDLNSAVPNLVRVYRTSSDEKMRKLALATLHAIQNDWALGILKRDLPNEKSPVIKELMTAIIHNDWSQLKEYEEFTMLSQ